jgi:hypothetical protein
MKENLIISNTQVGCNSIPLSEQLKIWAVRYSGFSSIELKNLRLFSCVFSALRLFLACLQNCVFVLCIFKFASFFLCIFNFFKLASFLKDLCKNWKYTRKKTQIWKYTRQRRNFEGTQEKDVMLKRRKKKDANF